jgi:biopolymer transport protein ExbD
MYLNQSLVASDPFEKHLIKRKRKKNWGKKALAMSLMLTSMVDMFSMLVVFLLQTFSSSPEILITKGLTLPDSITSAEVKEAPVVSLSKDGNLYLDQILVGETKNILKDPQMLIKKLNVIKNKWVETHSGTPFPGEINLQADETVKSTTVSNLMGILTNGQFQSIQLAVMGVR